MTHTIDADAWLRDVEPSRIKVGGKSFDVYPVSFNAALQVSDLVSKMTLVYEGEIDLAGERESRMMLDALLGKMRFRGWDWWQRRSLRRRVLRIPLIHRFALIGEIADHFTDSLRKWLAPMALEPEGSA